MGNTPCGALLGRTGILRMRGHLDRRRGDRAVMPMTHPAYLLRNPAAKREAWADLLEIQAKLRETRMKILAFSDLHLARARAEEIVAAARVADLVIGAGDFCNMRKGLAEAMATARRDRAPLGAWCPATTRASRSCAMAAPEGAFVLHGDTIEIGGVTLFGIGGGVPVTPFGAWSWDLTEAEAAELLASADGADVIVSHSPPKGIADRTSTGLSVGSTAVRAAVERVQPKLLLCGHIHDCWGEEGHDRGDPGGEPRADRQLVRDLSRTQEIDMNQITDADTPRLHPGPHRRADRVRHPRARRRPLRRHAGRPARSGGACAGRPRHRATTTGPRSPTSCAPGALDPEIDVVISTGGTGLTGRDVTVEAHRDVYEKEIDAFGTVFTMVCFRRSAPARCSRAPPAAWPTAPTCSRCPARPAPARMPGTRSSPRSSTTATRPATSSRFFRVSTSTSDGNDPRAR